VPREVFTSHDLYHFKLEAEDACGRMLGKDWLLDPVHAELVDALSTTDPEPTSDPREM